jgi:hypothetical protein
VTRFFPSYGLIDPPPRAQQRIGTGGYTEYKGSSADGGGGVKIGVIDNPDDSYDAYGYISFNTGHSEQDSSGYIMGFTGDDPTYNRYGQLTIRAPVFTSSDNAGPYISMREYGTASAGRSFLWNYIRDTDNTNQMVVGQQIARNAAGAGYIYQFGDAWGWYDNPTTGAYTALMALNASGDLTVAGALSKGSGSFDIPHPAIEGKRLRHSFIEGPYADLIYRGTVTLEANPTVIDLDNEFNMTEGTWEALNHNPWSMAAASGEVVEWGLDGKQLTLSGDEGVVCNWMVIGERHDQHMLDHGSCNNEGRIILEYDQPSDTQPDMDL